MNPLAQRVAEIVDQLTTCVCDAVATIGAGPVCFCGMVASPQPSWDYCGECNGGACGMAFVNVAEVFPYEVFPEAVTYSNCDRPLALTVLVGALRCAPTMTEDGTLPNEADQSETALAILADMAAIYEAVTCCGLPQLGTAGWQAFPEAGGCAGGRWEFQVALNG